MSSNTNLNNNSSSTSAPSVTSDWLTIPNAQLNWDNNDTKGVATAKFQERCWHKKIQEAEEHKHWEEEECCKAEEAEQRCKAEEEARAHTAAEKKCKKKKRVRKSTMADNEVVVEGWKTGQLEARGSNVVAEAICKLMRELTGQLDMLTSGILKELQGQSNTLENLIKTQQNIGWKMSWHYTVLEDMLGELEVFATNPGEPLEEEDTVDKEDLEEARGELEGLGPIVNIEEEMEGDQ
ncbi:hypothetical protein ID866_11430 [Astraeus odoratus]|nr:hypothetical protein ID866_11430 [Astraeus odoratus]